MIDTRSHEIRNRKFREGKIKYCTLLTFVPEYSSVGGSITTLHHCIDIITHNYTCNTLLICERMYYVIGVLWPLPSYTLVVIITFLFFSD